MGGLQRAPQKGQYCIVFARNLGSSVSTWHLLQTNVVVSDFAIGYPFEANILLTKSSPQVENFEVPESGTFGRM